MGGVTFATIHIVGSNDNYGRAPEMDAEHLERKAANVAWMKQAFARAKADNSRGLVLMIQANPGFENHWPARPKQLYFALFRGVRPPIVAPSTAATLAVKAATNGVGLEPIQSLRHRVERRLAEALGLGQIAEVRALDPLVLGAMRFHGLEPSRRSHSSRRE
jgi:hypothetical protein